VLSQATPPSVTKPPLSTVSVSVVSETVQRNLFPNQVIIYVL
jgi:hypothetical protein